MDISTKTSYFVFFFLLKSVKLALKHERLMSGLEARLTDTVAMPSLRSGALEGVFFLADVTHNRYVSKAQKK